MLNPNPTENSFNALQFMEEPWEEENYGSVPGTVPFRSSTHSPVRVTPILQVNRWRFREWKRVCLKSLVHCRLKTRILIIPMSNPMLLSLHHDPYKSKTISGDKERMYFPSARALDNSHLLRISCKHITFSAFHLLEDVRANPFMSN